MSERIRLATLCELEEHQIASLLQLELKQRQRKAFVDRHRHGNEEFGIRKPVLVFQTRKGEKITVSVDWLILGSKRV